MGSQQSNNLTQKPRSKSISIFCMGKSSPSNFDKGTSSFSLRRKTQTKEWLYYVEQSLQSMSQESKWTVIIIDRLYEQIDMEVCANYQRQVANLFASAASLLESEQTGSDSIQSNGQGYSDLREKTYCRIYKEMKLQINKPDHPFQIINKAFHKYFTRQYKAFVLKSSGQNDETVKSLSMKIEKASIKLRYDHLKQQPEKHSLEDDINFSDKVLGDVKRLIAILLFTILKFYQFEFKQNEGILEHFQERLTTFITKKVLSGNVYKIVLAICRYETLRQERQLKRQLKRLQLTHLTPQDLDISAYFLLNEQGPILEIKESSKQKKRYPSQINQSIYTDTSILHFDSEENMSDVNDEEFFFNKVIQTTLKSSNSDSMSQLLNQEPRKRLDTNVLLKSLNYELNMIKSASCINLPDQFDIDSRLKVPPYERVINKLKEIKNFESPLKKARIINEARDLIPTCIDEFWRGLDVQSDKLLLDADQLISIMTYSIVQSNITDLPGHIKLIEEFTSLEVQNGKIGQALFTLKAATENVSQSVHIRKQSIVRQLRSIVKTSNDFAGMQSQTSSIIKNLTKINSGEENENVSEDYEKHFGPQVRSINSCMPLKRGLATGSMIDPFLTELDDYGDEEDGYSFLFNSEDNDDEDEEGFTDQLTTSENI